MIKKEVKKDLEDTNEKAKKLGLVFLCKKCQEIVEVTKDPKTGKLYCQPCGEKKIKGEVFYGTLKGIEEFKKSHKHLIR